MTKWPHAYEHAQHCMCALTLPHRLEAASSHSLAQLPVVLLALPVLRPTLTPQAAVIHALLTGLLLAWVLLAAPTLLSLPAAGPCR